MLQVIAAISIPVAVVIIGSNFTRSQSESQRQTEEQRAQDEALQTYLEQMGSLLLDEDLIDSKEGDEVRILARARTLTNQPDGFLLEFRRIPSACLLAHLRPLSRNLIA